MTLYLLDTNTVSYIVTGRSPAARSRLEKVRPDRGQQACLSAVTVGEIFYGLEKAGANPRRRKALELFFATVTVHPWDRAAAEVYGQFRARQEARGKTLGPYDLQIAAHAIALGAVLVSHDKAFQQGTGLVGLEDWSQDV